MNIRFRCPRCDTVASLSRLDGNVIACPACDWNRPLPASFQHAQRPSECLCCGCPDLWRQKDFPQRVGIALVACGAILSSIAVMDYRPNLALAILMAFALGDMLLYALMPDVLVCYRCGARFRDQTPQQDYPAFSLDTAERYRQEHARLTDARAGDQPASSAAGPLVASGSSAGLPPDEGPTRSQTVSSR